MTSKTKPINGRKSDNGHAPLPPYPLNECLKVVGMSAAGASRFIEYHQLVTMEDMLLFLLSEAQ